MGGTWFHFMRLHPVSCSSVHSIFGLSSTSLLFVTRAFVLVRPEQRTRRNRGRVPLQSIACRPSVPGRIGPAIVAGVAAVAADRLIVESPLPLLLLSKTFNISID